MASSLNSIFLRMSRRAEQLERSYLVNTFVDAGPIFMLLSSIDHQVLFGRRGTGKTHAMAYLAEHKKNTGDVSINIDMRTLGSSGGIYADPSIPVGERATRLVIDTLGVMHDQILNHVVEFDSGLDLSKIGPMLDSFVESITEVSITGVVNQEEIIKEEKKGNSEVGIGFSNASFEVKLKDSSGQSNVVERKFVRSGEERHRIHFGKVRASLEGVVKAIAPKRIWIFLDEWSEVPLDLQPFLSDLLRRTIFSIQGMTCKIAAIEQRCEFRKMASDGTYVGVEVGADIATSLNLDEYMVFDNDAEKAKDFFKELIYKHVLSIAENDEKHILKNSSELVQKAFTQKSVFDEFVRSAEGVPRDAINIIGIAAQKANDSLISINDIRTAAKSWYNRGKESSVMAKPEAHKLLRGIVDEVIAHRRAKAFLIRSDVKHKLIDFLFDARILHLIKQGIAAHDQPGVRFNVYAIDYGCYVDLINTSRAPKGLFEIETDEGEEIVEVPANDYRSIRRAILDINDIDRLSSISQII